MSLEKNLINSQKINYTDLKTLYKVKAKLKDFTPFINYEEIKGFTKVLSDKNQFIFQFGECSESFSQKPDYIKNYCDLNDELTGILKKSISRKIVRILRLAGQYAKPRTSLTENRGDITLDSFRGEIINSFEFSADKRRANPYRMILAFLKSKETYGIIKSQSKDTFTSHEALLLEYEEPLTKIIDGKYYNLSAHMLWLGARTAKKDEETLEYLKKIENPIGIKISSSLDLESLDYIINTLNPLNKKGKIILIFRLGNINIKEYLEKILNHILKMNYNVSYLCDPMHGNTFSVNEYKTRNFKEILEETLFFFKTVDKLKIEDNIGLHLEATPIYVTECIDEENITAKNLKENYLTLCDPRLNKDQTINLISNLVKTIKI